MELYDKSNRLKLQNGGKKDEDQINLYYTMYYVSCDYYQWMLGYHTKRCSNWIRNGRRTGKGYGVLAGSTSTTVRLSTVLLHVNSFVQRCICLSEKICS